MRLFFAQKNGFYAIINSFLEKSTIFVPENNKMQIPKYNINAFWLET